MIVILMAILGIALGWALAGKRGGDKMDKLQYAAAYFIAFSLIGLFLTVLIERIL